LSRKQRLADIEIQRIAEFIKLRGAASLNASSQIARVVGAEAGFAEGAEQILERLESEEVNGFVRNLDVHLAIGVACASRAAFVGLRLIGVDVAVVHQLLDQAIHHVDHLLGRHVFEGLLDALGLIGIEHLALFDGALQCVLEVFERVLIPLAEAHVLILKSAFEEEIGQGLEEILGTESEVVAGETGVINPFHDGLLP
jgi:hypothetical protein